MDTKLVRYFKIDGDVRVATLSDVLETRPVFLIGSDARAHLTLADAAPIHAVVTLHNGAYRIAPRFLNTPVRVNGKPLEVSIELKPGDRVEIGSIALIFGEAPALEISRLPVMPPAPVLPALARAAAAPPLQVAPALATAIPSPGQNIYFPQNRIAETGAIGGVAMGLIGLLVIAIVIGYGLLSPQVGQTRGSLLAPYALDDGNVTIVMFDADW